MNRKAVVSGGRIATSTLKLHQRGRTKAQANPGFETIQFHEVKQDLNLISQDTVTEEFFPGLTKL
jgi:hypothetical protein